MKYKSLRQLGLLALLTITLGTTNAADKIIIDADVWADNWFSLYVDDQLIIEDSVSITTERSFNKESFSFEVTLPVQINIIAKDFKENDSGLEYIGSRRQQMGDGGLIVQFKRRDTGETILASGTGFRCLAIHKAPLNKDCEKSDDPLTACKVESISEPSDWKSADYDDTNWETATVYSESAVSPKDGYNKVKWDDNAQLIWTSDLETDNTLLCRTVIEG